MQFFHFIIWNDQNNKIVFNTYDHELEKEKQVKKKQRNLKKFLKQNVQTSKYTHLFNFFIVDFIIKKFLWWNDIFRFNFRLFNINMKCVIVRELIYRRFLFIFFLLIFVSMRKLINSFIWVRNDLLIYCNFFIWVCNWTTSSRALSRCFRKLVITNTTRVIVAKI